MKFWDSSALVALIIEQRSTPELRETFAGDPLVLAWTLSEVEIRSAICRLEREGALSPAAAQDAAGRLEALWSGLQIVTPVEAVKVRAKRLLGVHPLRAAEALQLGAALVAVLDAPLGWDFVCLDQRLGEATRREGFNLLPGTSVRSRG